jgi:methyl-accepting chemotaxis protein
MRFTSYRNWPILWKILSIPLMSLVLVVAGTDLVILPRIESWMLEQEKLKVQSVVEVAFQEIAQGEQAVGEGRLSLEQAQKEVIRRIRMLRYSGTEYFWINDLGPRMVMHPTKPELDGSDLTDNKDPRGKYLFREFVSVCRDKGEGFVDYMWPKPGEKEPSPKISFVKLHKPWGWIIGSGLYVDTFTKRVTTLRTFALGAAVIFSGALLLLGWYVARGIKRSLDDGCAFAAAVATGDLTRTIVIDRGDEVGVLGTSLNGMVAALRGMMTRVGDSVGQLSRASTSIARASDSMVSSAARQATDVVVTSEASREIHTLIDQVTQGVETLSTTAAESSSSVMELAASIEEVAQNMEKLSGSVNGIGSSIVRMTEAIGQIDGGVQTLSETSASTATSVLQFDTSIRQIETYAKESANISDEVRSDAETGRRAVEETIGGICEIRLAARITAETIASLSSKAHNIGSIVTVIEEIAQQTNLLALNAAIIAAQTGEHGKGFAVVAGEIKQLADRTALSTREIAEVIKGVQSETEQAVAAIGAAEESVRTGEERSQRAGEALGKIVTGVKRTTEQMSEIARATREQARGSEQIRTAMERISAMTDAIAESTRQQRSGSDDIRRESDRVRDFSSQVMRSMQEQAKVGDLISHMALSVSDSSAMIREACRVQSRSSERIQASVDSIMGSATAVLDETRVVNQGVATLGDQTEALQQEMAFFKVES